MPDTQHIVDQIRAILSSADQTHAPAMTDLAVGYAGLCDATNTRLRRCVDYLRRGHRAEAIHAAEEHPVLLEEVAALDFAEVAQWGTLCAMYELVRPPPLLIDAAQELNEAYAAVEPLQALLNTHRRLALERGSLGERIAVMRQIATLDAASAFWDEDLRLFESARLKQCHAEASAAAKARDRAVIGRLLAEVTAPGWRVVVPPELIASIQKADAAIGKESALRQIRELMKPLETAYGAMDVRSAAPPLGKIQKLIADTKLTLPFDLAERFESVQQWVKDKQLKAALQLDIDDATADLSTAIDGQLPYDHLTAKAAALVDLGSVVPETLQARLDEAKQRHDASERQRKRKLRIGVAATAAAGLVAAGIAVRAGVHEWRGREALRVLSAHHAAGDLPAALADIERYGRESAYALDRSDVSEVVATIRKDQKNDEARRSKFKDRMASARTAIVAATEAGIATDSVWNPVASAAAEAAAEAKTAEEKASARTLVADVDSARRATRRTQGVGFESRLAALNEKIGTLRSAITKDAGTPELRATVDSAGALVGDIPRDEEFESIRGRAETAYASVRAIADDAALTTRSREELDNVKQSADSADGLVKALRQYVERCAGAGHARQFATTIDSHAKWVAAEQGARLLDDWTTDLIPTAADTVKRLEAVATFTGRYANSPWQQDFTDYYAYLSAWQAAGAADGEWKGKFVAELDDRIYGDLKYVRARDGRRFYVPADVTVSRSTLNGVLKSTSVKYVIRPIDLTKDKETRTLKTAVLLPDQFAGDPVPGPQTALAKAMRQAIDQMDARWNVIGFELADRIGKTADLDPVLAVRLLKRTVEAMQKACWGCDAAVQAAADSLKAIDPDELAWMDPDDEQANRSRDVAARLVQAQTKALAAVRGQAESAGRQLRQRLGTTFVARGVLLREAAGWTVYSSARAVNGQRACVVREGGWTQVAAATNDAFVVDKSVVGDDLDGAMVFVFPPASGRGGRTAGD